MITTSNSGWNSRVISAIDRDTVQAMRSSSVMIELASPANYATHPTSGPWKFDRLIGSGVKREFVGRSSHDLIALRTWLSDANDMVLGWFSYDMKNLLERLETKHETSINFPLFYFFIPNQVSIENDAVWTLHAHDSVEQQSPRPAITPRIGKIRSSFSEAQYMDKVGRILEHIQLGDIYETNFCASHFATDSCINPEHVFERMMAYGQAPFSCRVAYNDKHLMCASPERFMAKVGERIISQPIKGTNRRQENNAIAMDTLRNDPKEQAENIMITDLVRNDLSKHAKRGSVKVDELCGVYPFAHVNQMVSTVSCELAENSHPLDMLLGAFPMGSMTGAPKVRAMQLMDDHEGFGRGLFSGSVGYFTPELDFDFNVVIRSILYDEEKEFLSFPTGSAITINSDPKQEYEECLLKAESMRSILSCYA